MGKKTSAPPAPNFNQAAEQTAAANRVNQITPYGSMTYEQSQPTFDQKGYDAAMMAYNNQPRSTSYDISKSPQENQRLMSGGGNMPMPDRSKFMSGGGQWTQRITLDPAQQALLDQQNKTSLALGGLQDDMMGQVRNSMGNQIRYEDLPQVQGMDLGRLPQVNEMNFSNFPQVQDMNLGNMPQVQGMNLGNMPQVQGLSLDNLPTIEADYGKTGFDSIMSRLNPQLDQQRQAFNAQMAAQGINLGSEAYNNAFRNQSQSENDARTQAALQGIGIGLQQQQQQQSLQNQAFNQRLGMFNSQLANRGQSLAEQQALFNSQLNNRGQSLAEKQALFNSQLNNRGQSLAEQQAMFNSQLANRGQSLAEQQALFGSQLSNQQQQYGLRTALADRPLNQLNALRSGSSVTNPTFGATAPGADYMNAANMQNQYNMGLYNSKVAGKNSMMGGLFGLGSSLISGGLF